MFKIVSVVLISIMVILFVYDYQLINSDNTLNIKGLTRVFNEFISDIQWRIESFFAIIIQFIEDFLIFVGLDFTN